MMPRLASIHVYPVKSLGGFAVPEAELTDRGLQHDRRWMLVDDAGAFQTQRELVAMACLHTAPSSQGFQVTDIRDGKTLELPWRLANAERQRVSVWSDTVTALRGDPASCAWFSERLQRKVHLVYMPDSSRRSTDGRYARGLTSLSDGFPYLIVSQASLDDLNARGRAWAQERSNTWAHVPMDRFRPNLVIAGGTAFQEDGWMEIRIGEACFRLVKPCARCVVVTTDQLTGERGREPLRMLSMYRARGNKVMFGMNAVGDATGAVAVGQDVLPVH
jgi:uncharacterized protein YcbX